jgi:hypothetical protein
MLQDSELKRNVNVNIMSSTEDVLDDPHCDGDAIGADAFRDLELWTLSIRPTKVKEERKRTVSHAPLPISFYHRITTYLRRTNEHLQPSVGGGDC